VEEQPPSSARIGSRTVMSRSMNVPFGNNETGCPLKTDPLRCRVTIHGPSCSRYPKETVRFLG
jgi:hypothetical protein